MWKPSQYCKTFCHRFYEETEKHCFNSGYRIASNTQWKTCDDLRSALSMMQFPKESNNPHFLPLAQAILRFLTEKLGRHLPRIQLTPRYSSVCFWILMSGHLRVTTLSRHRPRLWGSIPGIILIVAIMNLSDHREWNPLSVLPLFSRSPCILSVSLCSTSHFYIAIRM